MKARLLPFTSVALLIAAWQIAVSTHPDSLVPGPWAVVAGIVELAQKGLLVKWLPGGSGAADLENLRRPLLIANPTVAPPWSAL
jgi:hypothetical protein